MMEGRKLLPNASYFAFTATPKNKTLETFGTLVVDENGNPVLNEDGEVQHRPFHSYTMKQAIQEGFILDVLKYYTPISSYYKLMKTVQDDPMFDKKRAQKKLRAFVESDSYTISQKAEMMVEHFHEQVISKGKVGGQARAMVVTSSIPRCVEYYYAINKCLSARHSPYKTIVAFSGEHKYQDQEPALTSAGLNGFPDAKIPKMLKTEPYRILIVADMFQTGFDEPLLHTMYVDKVLYDIKAVQTLSRLNRCHPQKHDTFVLDFANSPDMIEKSFSRYYRTTLLSGETDPNKLYDLIATMEEYQVYSEENVEQLVDLYLNGAERDKLDPILDACAVVYKELDTDDQIKFKSSAIRERFECDEALHISIEGYESLFVISDSNKKEPGTDTILTLRPVHPWDRMNEEEFMQCIKGIVPNPAVQIEIETNKGSELYSSDYFDDLDLKPLLDYSWNNIKNIRKIDIDLTCEAYGFKGKGCIGILIKNGLPAEEIEILSKDVEIDGEIYTLSSNIKYKTNCITETSTSISVDEDGEIDTNTSWSERFKSKASLSIHGIEVPYNLFPDYSNGMSKAALKIPFPFSFRLDIGVNSDLNLNSARDQIIYDEKWLTFEENLYRIICRRLKDTLSSSDWKILNEIIQKNNTDTFSRVANSFE